MREKGFRVITILLIALGNLAILIALLVVVEGLSSYALLIREVARASAAAIAPSHPL